MLFSLIVILLCNLKHYLLQLIIIYEKNLKLNKETGVELAIKQKRPTFLNKVVAPFSNNYESFFFFIRTSIHKSVFMYMFMASR